MNGTALVGRVCLLVMMGHAAWAAAEPKIFVEQRKIDLGRVRQGESVTATFFVENRGDADIDIQSVRTSCSCTVSGELTADERRIEPGETLALGVTFDSKGRKGAQNREVTINSNDPIEPRLKLYLEADVVPLLEVMVNGEKSREWRVGHIRAGTTIDGGIDIFPTEPGARLDVERLDLIHPSLELSSEEVVRDSRTGLRLTLSVIESAPLRAISAGVEMRGTVNGENVYTRVQLRGQVVGELMVLPNSVELLKPVAPGNRLKSVVVRSGTKRPFEIINVDAGPALDVDVERRREGQEYRLNLQFAEGAPAGPLGTFLDIRTNVVQQPLVRVPIFAYVHPHVKVHPAKITLRDEEDIHRRVRVKLETARGGPLFIESTSCDLPFIAIEPVKDAGRRTRSVKFVDILLTAHPKSGRHDGQITIRTNVAEQPIVTIPVAVLVP